MSRTCLAVHHVRFEDRGSVAEPVAQHGCRIAVARLRAGTGTAALPWSAPDAGCWTTGYRP